MAKKSYLLAIIFIATIGILLAFSEILKAFDEEDTYDALSDYSIKILEPDNSPEYVPILDYQDPSAIADAYIIRAEVTPDPGDEGFIQWTSEGPSNPFWLLGNVGEEIEFTPQKPGSYKVTAHFVKDGKEATDDSEEIIAFKVEITEPTSFPVYIKARDITNPDPANDAFSLAGIIKPENLAPQGIISWQVINDSPSSGIFTFPHSLTTDFSAEVPGDQYVIELSFEIGDKIAHDKTKGNIIVFKTEIIGPSSYPVYIKAHDPANPDPPTDHLDLSGKITPSTMVGQGAVSWSVVNNTPEPGHFSAPTSLNTSFWSDVAGEYFIELKFEVGSKTSTDTTDLINVVGVGITNAPPADVQVCDLYPVEADGEPPGGAYLWSLAGAGEFLPDPTSPTVDFRPLPILGGVYRFGVGPMVLEAEYTLDVTDSDTAPTNSAFPELLPPITHWNSTSNILANNNCYNFATNIQTNSIAQPGRAHGILLTPSNMNCADVSNAAIADGLVPVDPNNLCHTSSLPNSHIVALVISPFGNPACGVPPDYHRYRVESAGNWPHKPGRTPAINHDYSNNVITNPETADRRSGGGTCVWNYSDFCGYFDVPPGVTIY